MKKEISILTTREGAEFIISAFFSQGIDGLKIDDPSTLQEVLSNVKNWDYLDKNLLEASMNLDEVTITAYINNDDVVKLLKLVLEEISSIKGVNFGSMKVDIRSHLETNWLEEWKKYYKPIISGKFLIIPIWQKQVTEYGEKIPIYINPGSAFGTGEHDTTKMCLELMSEVNFSGKNVADVGSGSGILGIAALKNGANICTFLDIDSSTLMSAKNNFDNNFINVFEDSNNKINNNVSFIKSDLLISDSNQYDIILANITAEPLIKLSGNINKNFSHGIIICSGIINENKNDVINAYTKEGFTLEKVLVSNSWVAILFSR